MVKTAIATEEQMTRVIQASLYRHAYDQTPKRKAIRAAYNKQYCEDNQERLKQLHQQYWQLNRDKLLKLLKLYAIEHAAELRAYRQEHREQITSNVLRFQQRHPKRFKQIHLDASHKHRSLKIGAESSYTSEEFQAKCAEYNNRCVYCGTSKNLTADHLIPLSRGGSDNINNIIPACKPCNSSKGTLTYEEYITELRKKVARSG